MVTVYIYIYFLGLCFVLQHTLKSCSMLVRVGGSLKTDIENKIVFLVVV